MHYFLIDLAFAVVVAGASLAGGWWLRGRPVRREPCHDEERRRAREVLGRLQDLALHMAANVGEHSSRVEEISHELSSAESSESETVLSAVARLIQANEHMQEQLDSAEERLHEQARLVEVHAAEARTDALTGMANRRAFDDDMTRRFAEFQRYGRPFSLVLADIDHFKRFNDTHGHQAGDDVLRGVARVLRKTARDTDLVARYGGEEFAIILPETTVELAKRSVERVRRAIEEASFRYQSAELHVTISLGVAEIQQGDDPLMLIGRADAALYGSKNAGRNQGHWHDGRLIHRILPEQAPATPPLSQATETKAECRPAPESTPPEQSPSAAKSPPSVDTAVAVQGEGHRERSRALTTRTDYCVTLGRRLAEWRRGGSAPAVLLVRVDHFPEIITRWGHDAGSLVLRATAQFLGAAIREMDMAADYEDGTFAMLLPGATLSAVIGIAERLRQAISRCTLPLQSGPLQFTVSIAGAVTIKSDETQTLLWRTEEALNAAATAGGNCSYFHNGQWPETVGAALERTRVVTS